MTFSKSSNKAPSYGYWPELFHVPGSKLISKNGNEIASKRIVRGNLVISITGTPPACNYLL